jgi:hypothetical protein
VNRLMSGEEGVRAFDPLCFCFSKSNVRMMAVVAAQNQKDMQNLMALRLTFPACRAMLIDTSMHNVTGHFHKVGLLRLFYACLFEYGDRSPSSDELLTLLSQSARQIDNLQSKRSLQMTSMRNRLDLFRQRNAARVDRLEQQSSESLRKLKAAQQKSAKRLRQLSAIYASRSWRLTKPLRTLLRLLRRC